MTNDLAAADLFCGVGGLSYGLVARGVHVVAGIDSDHSCRHSFETNVAARFIGRPIETLSAKDVAALYPPGCTRVLVGCAPCQPFSVYNPKRDRNGQWALLKEFIRLINALTPEIVSMENVPRIVKHPVYAEFQSCLERNGYHYVNPIVACADYGVPQTRRRLVILGSRLGPIEIIPATHAPEERVTVRAAIGQLPAISAGETHPDDPLHMASSLSQLNLERIRHTPEGGGWRDWPVELRAACHRRRSGKTYPSVYGRMKWDDLAPTITTQCHGYGNGRFGHPEQNRAISLREAALLQTFPQDYDFVPPNVPAKIETVARHIGNAVPVKVAEAIGESIRQHMEKF